MKEQELRERLNSLTGPEIPAETHYAFLSAVSLGKDGKIMKKRVSAGLVIAIILLLITAAAIATGMLYDTKWWYENRFAETDPEMVQGVVDNLIENPEQQQGEDSLVNIVVQETAMVPEKGTLTIAYRITPKDPEHYELHNMFALDVDGSYMSKDYVPPEDADEDWEERNYHMLWVGMPDGEGNRHGPVAEMMDDSSKRLLLIDLEYDKLSPAPGRPSMDEFRTPEGEVIYMVEYTEYRLYNEFSEEVTCTVPYRVVEYTEGMDDKELYQGGTTGQLTFSLHNGGK